MQVAAGQACGFGIALGLAHIERLGRAVDRRQGRCGVDETVPDHSAGRMTCQQGILGKFHARRGAVTQSFFGHESGAKLAALRDGKMSRGNSVDHHRAGVLRQPLSRQRCEQLILAVAGDAGDAQDFTTFQFKRDVSEPDAVRIVGLQAEIVDNQARHRGPPSGGGLHFLDVGPDHHARKRCGGFRLRVAGRDLLAAAQDRGRIAQPFDLFQLVADVEDSAALGLQSVQHDEQLVGFLRGQYRGRLIQDQEFGILHQRPNDFDALTFAYRQLPDLAPGIERKSVNIGHFLQTRRHVLERFLAVQTQRHVLGDGEIVEQREMLEHHADAARAGFRWSGEHHFLPLPAHLTIARLYQSVDGFDERRFPRAVLAEQRMDLPRPDIDIDLVVGEKIAVAFGQPNRL